MRKRRKKNVDVEEEGEEGNEKEAGGHEVVKRKLRGSGMGELKEG